MASEPILKPTETTTVETSEVPEIDLDRFELVKPREMAARDGVSEKTIYNRIHSGFYRSHDDGERIWVVTAKASETASVPSETVQKPTEEPSVSSENLLKEAHKVLNEVLKVTEGLSKREEQLQNLLSERKQLPALNNQLEAAHSYIKRIKHLEQQHEELLKRLEALEGRPWWKFWQ